MSLIREMSQFPWCLVWLATCCRAAVFLSNDRGGGGTVGFAAGGANIVNGSAVESPSELYPFFALPTSGKETDSWLGCGASIISPTAGISSAHCFGGGNSPCTGPTELSLWIGDVTLDPNTFGISPATGSGKRSFKVDASLVCHESWDGKCAHGADIAILKLKSALPDWVKPVDIFLGGGNSSIMDATSSSVTIIGYGNMELASDSATVGSPSPDLRHAQVGILSQEDPNCARVYAGGYGCSDEASEAPATNLHQQICAGSMAFRDSCAGDSGSPVLVGDGSGASPFVQVGIVSYGGGPQSSTSGPGRECGDPAWPGIYARTSGLGDFLCKHVPDMADHNLKCASSLSAAAGSQI